MVALWNRADHYIFILWFVLLLSIFFHRLISAVADWMSATHDVALVRILDACRKRAARAWLAANTGRKNRQKFAIWSPSHNFVGYIFATKARIDNRKKNLLSNNIFSTCSHNMVNFSPLAAEIGPVVCGTPENVNGFRILAVEQWARAQLCGVEPPIFGRATVTLGIGPHSSCCLLHWLNVYILMKLYSVFYQNPSLVFTASRYLQFASLGDFVVRTWELVQPLQLS